MSSIHEALAAATTRLTAYLNNPTSARQEAYWLMAHVLGISHAQLLISRSQPLTAAHEEALNTLLHRRIAQNTPLAYLLGTAPFCGLTIAIQPPILIPRHETEELVTHLIAQLAGTTRPLTILDMCSGSGCIALALAFHLPTAQVIGVDINPDAIALAQQNKKLLEIENVTFIESDLFAGLAGHTFDLIVSNPPYLSESEWTELAPDVKEWESPLALMSGPNGLELYEAILKTAPAFLSEELKSTDGARIILEHGATQSEALEALCTQYGYHVQSKWRDSFNHHRAIFIQ